MTISIGYKALDISISMPLDYRGMTRGLLGNFNGVTGDDFVLPDGTTLASDLTDRQIYEDFGPQCKLFLALAFSSFVFTAQQTHVVLCFVHCRRVLPEAYFLSSFIPMCGHLPSFRRSYLSFSRVDTTTLTMM